jgi:hypothetical protein
MLSFHGVYEEWEAVCAWRNAGASTVGLLFSETDLGNGFSVPLESAGFASLIISLEIRGATIAAGSTSTGGAASTLSLGGTGGATDTTGEA